MFVAVAVASVFSSCTKNLDGSNENISTGNVKAVLSATAEDVSKATLDGLKLKWEAGDELVICQYGNYASGQARDYTRNPFTYNTQTGTFDGSIANYHSPEAGSDYYERFYAGFPSANVNSISGTTGKFKINTNASQSGKAADFGKYATYLGYQRQREADKPLTSYEGGVLTFLNPFDMICNNPVLKFNVPEVLSVKNIVVSAFKESVPVNIAGQIQCRNDAKQIDLLPAVEKITISDGDNLLSGDVYVVLAPNAKTPDADKTHNYFSDIDAIVLDLTKDDGATASLKLTLAGNAPVCGVVKNLKSLPETLNWTYPEGPGIATIGFAANSGNSGRFAVTTENESSTLKCSVSTNSFGELTEPTEAYPADKGGIARGDNGITYVRFCTTTGVLSPRIENAMVWGFSKSQGFGKQILANFQNNTVGATYTYAALTYTITIAGTTAYPYCQAAGLNFMNTDDATVSKGYLSFSALEGGTGRIMIQSPGSGRTVTVTNVTKGTSVSKSLTSSQGVVVTDSFAVSKDDVIKVEFNKSVQVQSMSFVWETAVDK